MYASPPHDLITPGDRHGVELTLAEEYRSVQCINIIRTLAAFWPCPAIDMETQTAVGMKCIEDPLVGHVSYSLAVTLPWRPLAAHMQPVCIPCVNVYIYCLNWYVNPPTLTASNKRGPSGRGLCGATCVAAITEATLERGDTKIPCDGGLDGVITLLADCMKSEVGPCPKR